MFIIAKLIRVDFIFLSAILCLTACDGSGNQSLQPESDTNPPIGYIDGVRKVNEDWVVFGWACQPGLGSLSQVKLFLNDVPYVAQQISRESAEDDIHQLCRTASSSLIPYRFALRYRGPIAGQKIRIDVIGTNSQIALNGSNEFGLPFVDPEAAIASAERILVLTAHEDDEIWFAPVIGKYCQSKTCRVVTATSKRDPGFHPDPIEFENAMAYLPAVFDRGVFSSGNGGDIPSQVMNRWEIEADSFGLMDLNNVVRIEIDKFAPDVILTFDPRHGTSCHSEHRAVGQAVINGIDAYSGPNFDKSKLFLLTSRRIDLPQYSASIPAAPKDQNSVVYDMSTYIPAKGVSGFDFFIQMMGKYPTQFPAPGISQVLNSDKLDRVVSLLPIASYRHNDIRYTNSHESDPRIDDCIPFDGK